MDKKPIKDRYYTFMVVPHDATGRVLSIKIPALWLNLVVGLTLFFVLLVGSSVIYSTVVSRRLIHYADALAKNREQLQVIKSFSVENSKVKSAIKDLEKSDNELRGILGLKGWKTKMELSSDTSKPESKSDLGQSFNWKQVNEKLKQRKSSLEELKGWVRLVQQRFASTPSRWPTYGRIGSVFGYRTSPWRGFHAGIDISTSYGTPARVTADGIVTSVGWMRGYGKTVIVNHGNGVSTLYAHNSGYAVSAGQRVFKGQVVSYVGMTGYTTGPHLHYEVRKWERPINPIAYLNLNILSASKLWSN
jgi:murein DD-endopeptidase MepM/ murein hydrolase activator NlpD